MLYGTQRRQLAASQVPQVDKVGGLVRSIGLEGIELTLHVSDLGDSTGGF